MHVDTLSHKETSYNSRVVALSSRAHIQKAGLSCRCVREVFRERERERDEKKEEVLIRVRVACVSTCVWTRTRIRILRKSVSICAFTSSP